MLRIILALPLLQSESGNTRINAIDHLHSWQFDVLLSRDLLYLAIDIQIRLVL
jgi:hypothetical protein